jgi:hypothetical protein
MQPPVGTHFGQAHYSYGVWNYAGICVDPVTGTFWAANTFKPGSGTGYDWGTGIASFSIT